ncbi:MAG: preprotein translocase subunit SecG [Gammaproteobacteria bacterium]|nr:preprotein translocase subunit SecG [Gammaproteobacteria bacterium]
MYQFILILHMFACLCIVALVLVQQGKGATMGAAFGSGASQTVFGSRGSGSFLLRVTVAFVAIFFSTSITLNYMATKASRQEPNIVLPIAPDKVDHAASVTPNSLPTPTGSTTNNPQQ